MSTEPAATAAPPMTSRVGSSSRRAGARRSSCCDRRTRSRSTASSCGGRAGRRSPRSTRSPVAPTSARSRPRCCCSPPSVASRVRCGSTVLPYFEVDDDLVICGTNGGGPHDPQWVKNIEADGTCWVTVNRRQLPATAHVARGEERERVFEAIAPKHGGLRRYQEQTSALGRDVPLVVITPRRSDDDRCDERRARVDHLGRRSRRCADARVPALRRRRLPRRLRRVRDRVRGAHGRLAHHASEALLQPEGDRALRGAHDRERRDRRRVRSRRSASTGWSPTASRRRSSSRTRARSASGSAPPTSAHPITRAPRPVPTTTGSPTSARVAPIGSAARPCSRSSTSTKTSAPSAPPPTPGSRAS